MYNQALLIITTLQYFDTGTGEYQRAIQQLHSIAQLAIKDENSGLRWKYLADSEDLSNSAEETLALLAEAYAKVDIHPEIIPGIVKWLLTSRNEDHWSSTKATSAIVTLLLREYETVTGMTQTIFAAINNKELSVTDDLVSGSSFAFVKENKLAPLNLRKQNSAPAAGNIISYYFASPGNVSNENKEVRLKKELFKFDKVTSKWEPITGSTSLRIADRIKVELTIESTRALHYLYVDDKRAAGFEPKDLHSGYRQRKRRELLSFGCDAGFIFFSEYNPSGTTGLTYEMIVAHEGDFINGPATLQCMYKPEVNACSNSVQVRTSK